MKPRISIICPGIRVGNWQSLYDSICASTSRPFELIIIGPYALPEVLQNKVNVKYIKDYGSPVRCLNMGFALCEGDLLLWSADDGSFLPGMIDKAIDAFESMEPNFKNVLITKYMEGERILQPESYFKLCNAYPRTPFISEDWWIFNLIITNSSYFNHLGGLDSEYETLAVSHADLAVRAQRDQCVIKVFPDPIVYHAHGHPDHTPIERGHVDHDEPLYRNRYSDPNMLNHIHIDINGWKKAPSVWTRRFVNL